MMSRGHNGVFRRVIFSVLAFFICLPALGASFDCNKAKTNLEIEICANPELSKLDEEMSARYKSLIGILPISSRSILVNDQLSWIKKYQRYCDQSPLIDKCLVNFYKARIDYFTQARKFSPYIVIRETSESETTQNGFLQSISGDCSIIVSPKTPEIEYANGVISGKCSPPFDEAGESLFYLAQIKFINNKIYSFEYLNGHNPTNNQIARYEGGFETDKFDNSPITEDDFFQPGSDWRTVVMAACHLTENDPRMMFNIGGWLISETGLQVTCGQQERQNTGAGSAVIPWATLKPFMKPDAIAP